MSMRPGMTQIVAQLRSFGAAATTDEFNGTTYWTDEQLQAIADTYTERLTIGLKLVTRDGLIFKINAPSHYWMETDTYIVYPEGSDSAIEVTSTYNSQLGELVFDEALSTSTNYVVEAKATNLYLALSGLWEQKAAQRYDYAEFKAGNNRVSLHQEYEHCVERAKYYRNRIARRFNANGAGSWMR